MRSNEAYCPHRRTTCAPQGEPAALGRPGQLRREPPVLPVGVHRVGRGADSHPGGEQLGVRPRLEPDRVAADRQVEGERRRAGIVQPRQLDVGEVLGEVMARLDDVARTGGVRRVDRHLGPEPRIVGDVGIRQHPLANLGDELTGQVSDGVEQLLPAPPAEGAPVDLVPEVGNRRRSAAPHRRGTPRSSAAG